MKRIFLCLVGMAVSTTIPGVSGWAQPMGPCGPAVCPPQPEPARAIERTVGISVPVPAPPPVACHMPPRCGYACPPQVNRLPPRPAQVPVRVNVSVAPQGPENARMVPVVYCSPGPIKPVVKHTVGLAGAIVALPFRVADMFLPVYHPALSLQGSRGCGQGNGHRGPVPYPCGPPPACGPPPPMPMACAPPPCGIPMKCAPRGPSVAPLPRPDHPQPCGPYLPPRMVEDAELPCLEPSGLLSGLVNLPFRVLQQGRVLGDMNIHGSGGPCVR